MVKISDKASDDGSNGGYPNKKPKKEKNQNEKPRQQQVVYNILPNLPEGLIESIFALIPRDRYLYLSLASRAFRDIFTSPRLFRLRWSVGRTESVLYAFIRTECARWHILHRRRNNSLTLSKIDSLPTMNLGSSVVTIGHEIYIIGGKDQSSSKSVTSGFAIDCRFHTWRSLPDMQRARNYAAAGVIDGNIYVIGGCNNHGGDEDWIEVFDVKRQIWENVPDPNPYNPNPNIFAIFEEDPAPNVVMGELIHVLDGFSGPSVVMGEKIYIWEGNYCLAYEPRQGQWSVWGIESPQRSLWPMSCCCVVDDMLYSLNPTSSSIYQIVVYDPMNVVWRPVKGISRSDLLNLVYYESKMANFGGKLVILGKGQSLNSCYYFREIDIGCIVIALKRHENGEIWGNVESKSLVLTCSTLPLIEHSRTVTV